MKIGRVMSSLLLSLICSTLAFGASYNFDTKKSEIKWEGKKVSGSHTGTVDLKSGALTIDKSGSKGTFEIDMTTIKNLDLSGEWKTKLENHLNSNDFFNVEKFPTSTFTVTKVEDMGSGKYKFVGDLTVKGIKKPIEFPATISKKGDKSRLTASFKIDRLKWDIKYNSGKFFDVKKLGDKMIYDDIEFKLDLVTK